MRVWVKVGLLACKLRTCLQQLAQMQGREGGGAEGRREIDGELDGKYGGALSVHRCMCIHMCTCTSMHTYIYISIDTQRNKKIDNHKNQEKNLRK